ncbi:hypothetical protein AAFX91_11735 [Bradyrhizobium sp. 31Argb]|uniref:hypothetical protein n=1 Tax=Bradyrhizobium sp. 31Argb TaxID=3141247 RepID=UPI00374794B6
MLTAERSFAIFYRLLSHRTANNSHAMALDLITPVTSDDRLHPNFLRTLDAGASGVRAVLQGWADGFVDRDGKFVHEFQTTYNSGFWELYLFAVLKELGIDVDFSHAAPDFVARDLPLVIEATIASHAHDDVPEWEKTLAGITHDQLGPAYVQSIIRLSNALLGKSKRYDSYSAKPFMAGRSYIIAISNYGTQDFYMLGDVAMQRLLYDQYEEKQVLKSNGAPVAVGLFRSDAFKHISGILYSTTATFGKARALGNDEGDFVFQAVRIRNNLEPVRIIAQKKDYKESLIDGLRLFTNPFAEHPVDLNWFDDPGVRIFAAEKDGGLSISCHPDGDLYARQVHNLIRRSR